MRTRLLSGVISLVLLACGGDDDGPPAGSPDAAVGQDQTVVAFDGTHVYFGAENRRSVDASVTFPAPGQRFERVTLHLALRCPEGGCDWWDRFGRLALVENAGTPDERELELARFITPYRVAASWDLDVTELQRLLEGDVTLRVFIDTWVGPGHQNGAGWLVDASFELVGGIPVPDPFAVAAVWSPRAFVYGDPSKPTAATATIMVPAGAGAARLRAFITGHGQGNADNCAEFCSRRHWFEVNGETRMRAVWRDDCATTAVPGQQGTWMYPRAGWCPGAPVLPWTEDLYGLPAELTIGYDVEAYENTCRPDAATCTGCTLGTGCEYDGGAHTEPRFEQSALIVFYR